MTKKLNGAILKKIVAIFSSVLLLAGSTLPVFAESTILITGNGSDSVNNAVVTVTNTTQVTQANNANISNNVTSNSNSGGNDASHNTGGNVTVDTGNAKTQVTVSNTANTNVANVANCNCGTGNLNVKVSGNGDGSVNTANTALTNQVQLGQTNSANIGNVVAANSDSGNNGASHNTGGTTSLMTGNATTKVNLLTNANQNLAQVGGGVGNGSTTDIMITGNGSDSHNVVNLGLTDWVVLGQTNSANVENLVTAASNTGRNGADFNTGGGLFNGDVKVDTGNAETDVTADTAVNFNQAAIGCDCLMGVTAKIAGNGASDPNSSTTSLINAKLSNGQAVGQANDGEGIENNLNGNSMTGFNGASLNTGEATDPSVMTGDSTSTTTVKTDGNANVFGSVSNPFPWNWSGSNTNVTLTFSLQELLLALGMH